MLVIGYAVFVVVIRLVERGVPSLGETDASTEAAEHPPGLVDKELMFVFAGVVAMAVGASSLVEAIVRISGVESMQAKLGVTIAGCATSKSGMSLGCLVSPTQREVE